MKMILKFKDGLSSIQDYTDEEFKNIAADNFIESMAIGSR